MRSDYFSIDYRAARDRFCSAAAEAGAALERFVLPGFAGPDGNPLSIDCARIGDSEASTIVLCLSGTHGVEGFCGSAAQLAWLSEQGAAALPAGVAVLFVHAVNPFGFAWFSRYNENGVDINRNSVDFTAPLPTNALYDQIHGMLPRRQGYDENLVQEWEQLFAEVYGEHGDWAASDALTRGQYTHPMGLEFGGQTQQWSTTTLIDLLIRHCRKARHIAYVDWHSLLHLRDGDLVYLCFNETDDPLFERAATWWGRAAIDRASVDAQWGQGVPRSGRRPSRHGLLMWGLQHAVAPSVDLAGAVIEFCADADLLSDGLRAEIRLELYDRWLRQSRDLSSPSGREIVCRMRESLSPTRIGFREKAMDAALASFDATISGAGRWHRDNVVATPGRLRRFSAF